MVAKAQTPLGQEAVLKLEELEEQMSKRRTEKYIEQSDGTHKCRDCGGIILAARVAHPIWDGPFAFSGSGKCFYKYVPYCPNCEEKPSVNGSPIAPKGSYHNP